VKTEGLLKVTGIHPAKVVYMGNSGRQESERPLIGSDIWLVELHHSS